MMNIWEDKWVIDKVKKFKKNKIVIVVFWIEVCGVGLVLFVIEEGYDVYFVIDVFGGVFKEVYDMVV